MRRFEISLKFDLLNEGPAVALNSPALIHEYLAPFYLLNPVQEMVFVVPLNRKNFPLGAHRVALGSLTGAVCHPRECLRIVLMSPAASWVLGHSHPSGVCDPSSNDIQLTRVMREASKAVDVLLLDHVISSASGDTSLDPRGRGFYSFREAGLL
jgi:DNA repair protein RadC